MLNRDIYLKDPSSLKILNDGVANVNDVYSDEALEVLRFELETFVCEGQYEFGMEKILNSYLANLNQVQQPAVWVSGFFGSGKSHFVKMLRALWDDIRFSDGATARGVVNLPTQIHDKLVELETQAKRIGKLHAASGTLGASADGSCRLSLLNIIFKSANLPEDYPRAHFIMWLKSEGIYEDVEKFLEDSNSKLTEELQHLYVSEKLHDALIQVKRNVFKSRDSCAEVLQSQFRLVSDITSNEMCETINQVLTRDGKFPLTLVVLDEIQQYLIGDLKRVNEVQELVEKCSTSFDGKLLFVGTGQTAITGVPDLSRLAGRFTVRVELSDTDVDAVVRKVILAKKPEAISQIDKVVQSNIGEISRHLSGTTIGHIQDDTKDFCQDYPILPVRRRFWENALRTIDQTLVHGQLRNQLSLVHKAIKSNLDKPLKQANVIPADFLYFETATQLLQTHDLPKKVYEATLKWNKGNEDEKLKSRAVAVVFLINKLNTSNQEIGIKATVESISDLLIDNLSENSSSLRSKLPYVLENCELLMKISDEFSNSYG